MRSSVGVAKYEALSLAESGACSTTDRREGVAVASPGEAGVRRDCGVAALRGESIGCGGQGGCGTCACLCPG